MKYAKLRKLYEDGGYGLLPPHPATKNSKPYAAALVRDLEELAKEFEGLTAHSVLMLASKSLVIDCVVHKIDVESIVQVYNALCVVCQAYPEIHDLMKDEEPKTSNVLPFGARRNERRTPPPVATETTKPGRKVDQDKLRKMATNFIHRNGHGSAQTLASVAFGPEVVAEFPNVFPDPDLEATPSA